VSRSSAFYSINSL
jgi:tubulin-specific chaperone C